MGVHQYIPSSADWAIDKLVNFLQTTDHDMNDKTAGLTRFNGEHKHWKTWKKQRNGYKIINEEEFEGYDGIPDPRHKETRREAPTMTARCGARAQRSLLQGYVTSTRGGRVCNVSVSENHF